MIKITNIKLPVGAAFEPARAAAKILKIPVEKVLTARVLKRSVDARDKGDIRLIYTIGIEVAGSEAELTARLNQNDVTVFAPLKYTFPEVAVARKKLARPIIVGAGPAGLFAALTLAHGGAQPILIERGDAVEARKAAVSAFWSGAALEPESNVQFGEGGAGTFSDGKLTTGIKDERCSLVLSEFVKMGAPEEILYESKPHIGTDQLVKIVRNLREEIKRLGGEVRFRTRLAGLKFRDGKLVELIADTPDGPEILATEQVILAVGHSARDTFFMLNECGAAMEQKEFSIGLRIEHLQSFIGKSQYGPKFSALPPADYKLAERASDGRGVYTFCMCPGGRVVNASSEPGGIAVNGMSEYARDGKNANAAVLVGVGRKDFGSDDVLAGVEFQRKYERAAYRISNSFAVPCQRVADFAANKTTLGFGSVLPSCTPNVMGNLRECLPAFAVKGILEALPKFERKLRGFSDGDAVFSGVETRSSSPIRILRGEDCESVNRKGLYPCGEGAGYAGGIMSAAVDGIRVAEAVLAKRK